MPIDDKALRYEFRKDKCEGIFTSQVSSKERISIVNFSIGKLRYDLDEPGTISIASTIQNETVQVEAHPIPLTVYYRMDASVSKSKPLEWRVEDILAKIRLESNNVGIFGYKSERESRVYIPVRILKSDSVLRLVVRSSVNIYDVVWRYSKVEANKQRQYIVPKNSTLGDSFSNRPITIPLPSNLKGIIELQILAKVSGTLDPLPNSFILFLP